MKRITALICLFCFSACSLNDIATSEIPPSYRTRSCAAPGSALVPIFVVNLGWHTGIVIPSAEAGALLNEKIVELKKFEYVEFGWGDAEFYQATSYSYWTGFKALFFAGDATLHVTGLSNVADYLKDKEVVALAIERNRFTALTELIRNTLKLDNSGNAITLGDALYGNGHFYAANGNTSVCTTCNTWNAEALKEAGCPISASLVRSSALIRQLTTLPEPN